MKRLSVRAMHFRSVFMSTTAFAASIALAIVLWRGGIITRDGVILIGTLSVFMNYAQGMMEPVQWLVQVISSLVNVQVNVERFTKLMETESDVRDTPEVTEKYGDVFHPKKENWEPLYGDIEFQDVTFRYPDGSENVLEHFDLKVPQGTNVAIVGETGAGKSTLVNLVCRFFEPTEGRVLIDGRDARERSQLWLHSNIGYVLQTPHLFSGTVLENLLYGRPDATMAEIEAAVKAVSADQIIARLPDGYNSDIGEGGNSALHGRKAAAVLRPRAPGRPSYFCPRRGDQLRRHCDGAAHPERHRKGHGRPHLVHHRPPPVDHPPRGCDPRRPRRQDRRKRHAPLPHGCQGRLLPALHTPVPRGADEDDHGISGLEGKTAY